MADTNGSGDATVESVVPADEKIIAKTVVENIEICKEKSDKISDLESKVIRQIEYYFGDINLGRDKFLQEQIKLDDGWVPLSVLLTFKRLANMTTDIAVIADALDKSENQLVKVAEDRTKIRRALERPLPEQNEERRKELTSRTAYVKGFPLQETTLDILLDFMKNYNTVENVIMRTYVDKPTKKYLFKGSVFVTFATKEQCEEFLKLDKVEYEGTELTRLWQEKYYENKKEERGNKNRKNNSNKTEVAGEEVKEENKLPKGAVLHIDGLSGTTTREDIKEAIGKLGCEIAYVDFNKGDTSGWVRLQGTDTAKPVFEKCTDGKIKICDDEVKVRVLEGEEEITFLDNVVEDMKKRRQNNHSFRRGGRGGGRGGRNNWNNRKRKGSPTKGGSAAKSS